MMKKVLLVDDDPNTHRIHHYFLKKHGFQLLSAYSAREGLELAAKERPQVILLDFMMPEMDGEDFLHEFQSNPKYESLREIPVVMLTAAAHERDYVDRLREDGLAAYLRKPFGDRELLDVLENVLVNHKKFRDSQKVLDQIRESRDFLESVLNNFPGLFFTTDMEGRITYYNEGAVASLHHRADELIGRSFLDICVLNGTDFQHVLSQLEQGDHSVRREVTMITKRGHEVPFDLHLSAIELGNATDRSLLAIARDMTAEKKWEREKLERERVTTIVQTMATVNHEINNPLTPILGNVDLLLEEAIGMPRAFSEKLKNIKENACRIQKSVKKMRNISRPIYKEYYNGEMIIDLSESD